MKKHLLPLLFLILIVLWQTHSLFRPGWFASHDGVFHLRRVAEMSSMLKLGYFPVRWGLTLDNRYGIPLFNYVYPGPYYLAGAAQLLSGISSTTLVKILIIGAFALGSLGWYFLFERRSRWLAVFAAGLYLTTPYQLLNIFVRSSVGEIITLGILPWVLVAHAQISSKNRVFWYSPLPLFFVLISHSYLGLMAIPLVLIYQYFSFKKIKLIIESTFLSLGLASFFLLPLILERKLVLSGYLHDYSFRYFDHFVYFKQLLYSRWDYWFSMPGIAQDGITFQLGFAQMITVIIVIFSLLFRRSRTILILLGLYFVTIFLMLPISRFVWELFPIIQVIQFPWRLLSLVAFITPLLASQIKPKPILIISLLILGIINTRNYRTPMKFWTPEEFSTDYTIVQDKTTTSYRGELVPRWSTVERWQGPLATSDDAVLELDPVSNQGNIIFTATTGLQDAHAIVQKNYFPSWQGRVDSNKLVLTPTSDGAISVPLLSGTHLYTVKLGSTPLELLANLLSFIALYYLFVLGRRHVR